MRHYKKLILLLFVISMTLNMQAKEKQELLFYIGITMVKPVNELAKEFEKLHDCKIKILQGGSQDLYDSIKSSQKGDLYLPGSLSYRKIHLNEGLLLEGKFVGFNQLALVVQKGNPKNIKATLNELSNEEYRVVLGNEESGSIGKASKKVLIKNGNYEDSMLNAIFLAPDSRNLTKALTQNKADVVLNWYATTFWDDNKAKVQALKLQEKYAKKSKLVFNLLKTSKNKELTKQFLDFAASKKGQSIFHKYGFLDKEDLAKFDTIGF